MGLPIDRDDRFKSLDPDEVRGQVEFSLPFLDDLAVVVLFSVFESIVRDNAVGLLRDRRSPADHPVVSNTLRDAEESLREGSFFHVLEAYKGPVDVKLVEHVNQVRKYRNWVAHGRRATDPPDNVSPRAAYDRLGLFLATLGID
ncbi:MAG TPA: hypothetical protein VH092_35400 [Urbifossiella sp.]|nr:hypothetical protein [Urbifossiella sp.]